MTQSIFHRIRTECENVAARARWVTIDLERLLQYPETLFLNGGSMSHTVEHHLLGRGDETLTFFLILDSINFGSGYFPYLDKEHDLSGYFTIAKRLRTHCERHGIPTPAQLREISAQRCAELLGQDMGNPHAGELMHLFASALNQLGEWVGQEGQGDYLWFLRRSRSADEAVRALLGMRYFRDVSMYENIEVPFLKRAQILLQDMTLAEPRHQLLQFTDIDQLTVFADNVIPYVLKTDRVLKYHQWLDQRIQREELIGVGSCEEIELRACSVHAVELLHKIVSEDLTDIPVRQLDFCLWNRGQQLKKLTNEKRHRTRCVFY